MIVIYYLQIKFADNNQLIDDIDNLTISKSFVCEPEHCKTHIPKLTSHIKILQQNIRSINKNFPSIPILLSRLKFECDIVVLTECWLQYTSDLPTIRGYTNYSTQINFNQNDGITVFIKNNLTHTVEESLLFEANCLLVRIGTETIIIAIYRPCCFKNLGPFLESLNTLLTQLSSFKNIILVGDININIRHTNDNANKYLDTLAFHGMLPAHNHPTRLTNCLDHVIIKTNLATSTCVLLTSITDHQAVLCCVKNKYNTNCDRYNFKKKINLDKIIDEVRKLDFSSIYTTDNLDEAVNIFIQYTQNIILRNTIYVKLPRNRITLKPWITTGLLKCIKNRDRMHIKVRQDPNNTILGITYKRYRNFCNNIIRKCKQQYEKTELSASKNNNKKLWRTIKNITNLNKQKDPLHELLNIKPTELQSANEVNDFFAGIGAELASKIHTHQHISSTYICSQVPLSDSFVLMETTREEVESTIMSLKSDSAVGWDGISAHTLKAIKEVVAPVLTVLINKSLNHGVFPGALKKSIVVPVYKSGNRDCITNYRPISLLTATSKVFEKIMNKRINNFLEAKNLLSESQFGFRAGRSAEDAIHSFTDFVIQKIDNKKKCITIFLDLAKAFDTVSFPILIDKLEALGIRGTQLSLIRSYLEDRTQRVRIDSVLSQDANVYYGVPQGSIVGPTLFLCYINELCQMKLRNCKIISYADDTTLTFYHDTWEGVFDCAQEGFNIVRNWLAANYLTLNTEKTKYIAFCVGGQQSLTCSYNIRAHSCSNWSSTICTCALIGKTLNIKYLGITIDYLLSFKEHITSLTQRVRKLIYIFKKLRHVLDFKLFKSLYLSLCQSILSYGISSWGGAAKTHMLQLERVQRLILKVSLSKPRLYSTISLYRDTKLLSVRQIYVLATVLRQHGKIIFNTHHPNAHRRRHYMVCDPKLFKTSFAHRFFCHQGPRLYNLLNKSLNIYSMVKYKCKDTVVTWLITKTYDETEKLLTMS